MLGRGDGGIPPGGKRTETSGPHFSKNEWQSNASLSIDLEFCLQFVEIETLVKCITAARGIHALKPKGWCWKKT